MARLSCPGSLAALLLCSCNSGLTYYGPHAQKPNPIIDPTIPETTGPSPSTTETGSTTETDPTTGPDTTTPTTPTTPTPDPTTADTGTPVPAGPWTNGDPASPPPYIEPPSVTGSDCTAIGGIELELDDDDEVDVHSFDGPLESRRLTSPLSGWYDLYSRQMSHEEAGEWNESAMVRIGNTTNPLGLPVLSNCESNFVVVDPDNYVDPGNALLYMGTFWFDAGLNELQLEHLCPRVRLGACTELEFLDDPDTTCTADDGNSAHLDGERLCLVEPAP